MDEVLALISFNPVLHADLLSCPVWTVVNSESCALLLIRLHPELPLARPQS